MSKRMIDSELIEALGTDIKFDGTGNVTIGKNLEVDGKMQLNGGIKPIHTYKLDAITTFYVIFEDVDHDGSVPNDFMGYGWIERFGNGSPCLFYYALQNGKVSVFKGLSRDTIYEYSNNSMQTSKIAKSTDIPKLYRHVIKLSGTDSSDYTYTGLIIVESQSNLKVNTLQDLTTLLKPTDGFEYPLSGVVYKQNVDLVTELVPVNIIQFEFNVWKFYDAYSNTVDITGVYDTITAL